MLNELTFDAFIFVKLLKFYSLMVLLHKLLLSLLIRSLFKCESLLEVYNDAQTFGLKSANSVAASNSKLAISWLEATFPELQNQETEGDNLSLLRAHAYAIFDASIVLQVNIYSTFRFVSCIINR